MSFMTWPGPRFAYQRWIVRQPRGVRFVIGVFAAAVMGCLLALISDAGFVRSLPGIVGGAVGVGLLSAWAPSASR